MVTNVLWVSQAGKERLAKLCGYYILKIVIPVVVNVSGYDIRVVICCIISLLGSFC